MYGEDFKYQFFNFLISILICSFAFFLLQKYDILLFSTLLELLYYIPGKIHVMLETLLSSISILYSLFVKEDFGGYKMGISNTPF